MYHYFKLLKILTKNQGWNIINETTLSTVSGFKLRITLASSGQKLHPFQSPLSDEKKDFSQFMYIMLQPDTAPDICVLPAVSRHYIATFK